MPVPPRERIAGALFHVFDHAIASELLFRDDADRRAYLSILGHVVRKHRWQCLAYCLMGNHVHLLVGAGEAGLSPGMRCLKTTFALDFNRRHHRRGPLFRSRFGSPSVLDPDYLAEVCRYVVLNPVRAGMVQRPEDWPWSSYRATAGLAGPPPWLACREVLRAIPRESDGTEEAYRRFVAEGISEPIPDLRRMQRRTGTGRP